jgi:hypothetical protein
VIGCGRTDSCEYVSLGFRDWPEQLNAMCNMNYVFEWSSEIMFVRLTSGAGIT